MINKARNILDLSYILTYDEIDSRKGRAPTPPHRTPQLRCSGVSAAFKDRAAGGCLLTYAAVLKNLFYSSVQVL